MPPVIGEGEFGREANGLTTGERRSLFSSITGDDDAESLGEDEDEESSSSSFAPSVFATGLDAFDSSAVFGGVNACFPAVGVN